MAYKETNTTIKNMSHLTVNEPGPATLALHADDPVNVVSDVAPPLHLSTTYRYSNNPEDLVAWADTDVCTSLLPDATIELLKLSF
jgi:hypothetical protein